MTLQTERLILRPWQDSDADDLYFYAKDPDVGPIAGWPPHQSAEESLNVIRKVLSGTEAYALCLKEYGRAIGAIELKLKGHTDLTDRHDECELGYWLGKPFWGRGLMPEAARALLRRAFQDLGMEKVWCGYYDGNEKSKKGPGEAGIPISVDHPGRGRAADGRKAHRPCELPDEGRMAPKTKGRGMIPFLVF